MTVHPLWPPGSRNKTTNQCLKTMSDSSRAGPRANKLESLDDSEQCAVEYWEQVHNSYIRIPTGLCVEESACTCTCSHFLISPPLHFPPQIVCYSLMNKSIYDFYGQGSMQSKVQYQQRRFVAKKKIIMSSITSTCSCFTDKMK